MAIYGKWWKGTKQIGIGWGGFTALLGPGDFDRSNGPDLIGRTADGMLVLYRNNGSGGWGPVSVIGNGWGGLSNLG